MNTSLSRVGVRCPPSPGWGEIPVGVHPVQGGPSRCPPSPGWGGSRCPRSQGGTRGWGEIPVQGGARVVLVVPVNPGGQVYREWQRRSSLVNMIVIVLQIRSRCRSSYRRFESNLRRLPSLWRRTTGWGGARWRAGSTPCCIRRSTSWSRRIVCSVLLPRADSAIPNICYSYQCSGELHS